MQLLATAQTAFAQDFSIWKQAALATNQVDPFCCTPDWQLSFHDAFSPERRLLVAQDGGNSMAFAESIFSRDKIFLTPIEAHWFFGCPLLGADAVDMLGESLPFFERTYRPAFPKIAISGIRPKGRLAQRLIQRFSRSFNLYFHSANVQCAASLKGGVDGYLSRRSANHRSKLKKSARMAREKGVSFERAAPASALEAQSVYARMQAVELTSWKGIGKCGMAEEPVRQFYGTMLERLSVAREGRVMFATHEGKDIGFIFGGMAGRVYRGQQFSYNDEWKNFSLGNLMQMEQITWLCEEGAARYDMGPLDGPRMAYKFHWTEKELSSQTWILEKA